MLTPEGEGGEFEFYLKFAKPLVLNLPNTSDRIKAATWIRYLKKDTTDPTLRGEYLKLLLFVLQRRKLFGPFATIPDESKPLEKFPAEINIQDVAKNFVEVDKKVLKATLQRGGFGEWPPYTTACSSDLTEYAATQEIPNFGVQAYFAISRDPIQQWDHFEKAIFPIGESIETIQPECAIVTASPDISCFVSPDKTEPALPMSPPRPTPRISPYGPKDETPPKELEDVSPKSEKSSSPTRDMDDFNIDDRVPPTWGSNLVNVKDSPQPISPPSPVKDFDIDVSDQDMLDFFNDDIDLFEADIDEAASYLQGDTLTSPSRPHPVSQAGSPSPERHAAPSGEPPYPEDYIDDMAKDVDEDMKVIESKLPATTPQRSLSPQRPSSSMARQSPEQLYNAMEQVVAGETCPGPTCPGGEALSQRTSPQKTSLSPNKLFDALEYIADDKDMLDFFNDSLILPEDDPAFFLQDDHLISPEQLPSPAPCGSPRVSPSTSKAPCPGVSKAPSLRTSKAPCPGTSSTTGSKKSERPVSRISKVPSLGTSEAPCPGTSSTTGSKKSDSSGTKIGKVPSLRTSKAPCPGTSSTTGSKKSDSSVTRIGKVPSLRTSKAPCPGTSSTTGSKKSETSVSRISKVPSLRTSKIPCPGSSSTTGSKKSDRPASRISKLPGLRTSKAPCPGTTSTISPKKSERPVSSPCAEDQELRQLEEEIFGVSSEAAEQDSPAKDIASTVQQILEEMNQPSTSVLKTTGEVIEQAIMNKSGEDMGGDSFTAPDNQDYRWLNDMSGGPGLPEDEQQDPALWEPYEWWTDDPDEIFQNVPPSPRVYGTPEEDPYDEQRASWDRTPPIFSKDPRIREGPAAQRQYSIHEFGMESFEEPVWTSAEQYFKYKKDFSPFIDPRSIDRKSLDPSQFPNFEMQRQFADIRGAPGEEGFFGAETSPDYLDVSFTEQDFQPMSRIEAVLEAAKHDPRRISVPTSTPEKTTEEWALSLLGRPFLLTPPEPNPDINADELEDSLSKYIEEDLKIINAKVPVTTPQRSPSPKRLPNLLKEAPPFVPDIDVEPDPYLVSPELIFPDRHVVPPQKVIDWDENIGTAQKFTKTDSVVIESEEELRDRNLKRKQQLKLLLEREFASPPKVPTPPAMPHLMDEPIPGRRLPSPLPATKLPPSNWAWKTPPNLRNKPYIPSRKLTPTGISPPRPVSEEITMFYESPPEGFLSPSGAVESLQHTPSEGFGEEPSPIKSPGGRQFPECGPCDEIDMEMMYPTQFEEYDFPELYQSPEKPESPSPERKAWRDKVGAHEKTGFRRKTFVIRPKPGRSYRVTRSREPSLSPLVETSPPEPEPQRPNIVDAELESEIAALEAEIFRESPSREQRPPDPDELSPDYERRMWQESLKLHEPVPYEKNKRVIVVPKPTKYSRKIILKRRSQTPSLQTIYSPSHPQFGPNQREEQLRAMKLQAEREVEADKAQIKFKKPDRRRYWEMISHRCNEFSITSSFGRAMMRPKLNLPRSPEPYISPERPPHILDEPIPEGLPESLSARKLPPSNWTWKTPPKYQTEPYVPKEKKTPTGISPIRPVSQEMSMFFESPPEGFLSPSDAVSSLQFTSPEGFVSEPSPDRVPCAPQFDEIDREMMYPAELDDEAPEFYQSPEQLSPERQDWRDRVEGHEKTGFRRKSFVVRPKPGRSYKVTRSRKPKLGTLAETSPPEPQRPNIVDAELESEIAALEAEIFRESPSREQRPPDPDELSPDYERRMWQESLKLHEPVPYEKNKRVIVVPKPTKYSRKIILKRRSQTPSLQTIYSPSHPQFGPNQREEQLRAMKLQAEREVEADKAQIKFKKPDRRRYWEMISHRCNEFSITSSFGRAMMRPKLNLPRSPEPYISPERPPHILDEPIPEGLPESLSARKLPPSNWTWKTPPKYQTQPYVPKERKTPTGISPVRVVSEDITMFYESPPEGLLSPTDAVSSLQFTPPEGFVSEPSPDRVPCAPQFDEIDREMMYPAELDDESPEYYQSPEQLSPERQDWRDKVEGHEKTGFRRKSFVVRPKPGRSYKVTRSRKPRLGTLAETSPPEPQRPNIVDAELEAEISALEAEIFRESPSREQRPPDPDELSPDYERKMWQESLKLHEPVPYEKNKRVIVVPKPTKYSRKIILKRRSQTPSLRTIYSPSHPQFGPNQREEQLRAMRLQAEREVEADKAQIKFKKPDRRRYWEMISHRDNEFSITSSFGRAMMRPKLNLPPSPPQAFVSPERPPQIFDEPIPAGQPPSNWTWKTPPKYQTEPYVPKEKKTPTGISPVRVVSKDITMYYESPPEGLLSPTDAVSSLQFTPPEGFGSEPSPDRVPCAPQFDEIDREMLYPTELEDEASEFYQSPEQLSPERQDWRDRVEGHEKTGFRRKTFVVRPKPGRSYKVTRSRKPKLGTLAETSPPEPQRPNIVDDELESEIAALEAEIFRESPSREQRPPDPDELSPDYERRMWQESLKLHEPVPYDKNKRVIVVPKPTKYSRKIILKRRSQTPSLQTIYSPSHPQFGPNQREEQLRAMKLQAEREVEADKAQIKFKKPDRRRYWEMISHRCNEFSITSSFGRAMMRPKLNLPRSPEPYISPERPPHILDEPIPEGLSETLSARKLPPSNWAWKTPPKYQTEPYVPKEKKTPTGISPVRVVSKDITMYYESPPEGLLSPTDAVSSLQFTPPEGFGSEPSPDRVPCAPQFDEIDREMLYPTELEDEASEFYQSPEQLSPERQDWRDRVEGHEKTGFRRKTFVVRPKPGRSYKVTRSRKPKLGTLAETSPPEPQRTNIVDAELESEIAALEAEIFRESPSREQRPPDPDELSPDYERKIWQESLKLHEPVPYDKNKRVIVVPKPTKYSRKIILKRRSQTPSLRTIYSPSHPQFGPKQREEQLREMQLQAEREVEADKAQIKFKKPDRRRYCEMISHRDNEFSITSSFGRAMLRPKLNLPQSPEPYISPERPPHILDEPIPEGLPESLSARKLPPSNWAWRTPPKYQMQPYVPTKKVTPTGISPVRRHPPGSLFNESPPQMSPLPDSSPSSVRPMTPTFEPAEDDLNVPQYFPEGFDDLVATEFYSSPEYEESLPDTTEDILDEGIAALEEEIFVDYSTPARETLSPMITAPTSSSSPVTPEHERKAWMRELKLRDNTPYQKKTFAVKPKPGKTYRVTKSQRPGLTTVEEKYYEWSPPWSPEQRQMDTIDMPQSLDHYDLLSEESPEHYAYSPSPPTPPPRPPTPAPFLQQPRRIPRRRAPLDPNVLYASTPRSAVKDYQAEVERIRFEAKRPMSMGPTTPPPVSQPYYQSPIPPGTRPWKKRRRPVEKTARRRLEFEEDEREFERDMIEELQSHLEAASPGGTGSRDVQVESPPYDLDPVSLLEDFNYEPDEFNMFVDDDVPQYDVRPAFYGQPDVDLVEEDVDSIPYEQRNFRWMDYATRCPWNRS